MAYIVTNTQKICFFYEQSGEATPFAEVSNLRQADFCLSAEAACDLHQQVEFFCTGSQEASVFEVIPSTSNAIGRYYVTTVHGLLGSTADAPYDYGEAFFYTSFDSAKAAGDLWSINTRHRTPWFAVLRRVDKGADGSLLI